MRILSFKTFFARNTQLILQCSENINYCTIPNPLSYSDVYFLNFEPFLIVIVFEKI